MWAWLGLRKEALLLDSHLYILKAMSALVFAYVVGVRLPYVSLDMVSVLLGVMYNLQPANVLGLKGGLYQLLASALGALVSGSIIVLLNYQVGPLSLALGMGLTMWISLKIDYRLVSPVAIFTSLYMNLLLQTNAMGQPSFRLTLLIRLGALGFGLAVSILFNYLFSIIYYQNLGVRRLELVKTWVVRTLKGNLEWLRLNQKDPNHLDALVGVFNDVDTVKDHLASLRHERFTLSTEQKQRLGDVQASLLDYKNLLHLFYDVLYLVEREEQTLNESQLASLQMMVEELERLDFTQASRTSLPPHQTVQGTGLSRLEDNLQRMLNHHQAVLKRFAAAPAE